MDEHRIKVCRAPEPSNILWENQDMEPKRHFRRRMLTLFVFAFIIIISLAIIYVSMVVARGQAKSAALNYLDVKECDPVRSGSLGGDRYICQVAEAEKWTAQQAQQNDDTLECYCLTKGYSTIWYDNNVYLTCAPWLTKVAQQGAIMGGASLIVVLINAIVQAVLVRLAYFERSNSWSRMQASIMWKIAAAQVINTGFVPLVINWNVDRMPQSIRTILNIIPGGQFIGRGDYNDFVRGWYTVVGLTITTNMMANAVVPPLKQVFMGMVLPTLKRWWKTRGKKVDKMVQPELEELYTNAPFDISTRYADLVMTVFVCLTYSSGLPLLNVAAFLFMALMFWMDKIVLLRFSKRPPYYDTLMPKLASQYMIYAVPLHCIFAILMYGQECTFPSQPPGEHVAAYASQGESSSEFQEVQNSILWRSSTYMFTVFLFCFVGFWFLWTLLWILGLGSAVSFVATACCSRKAAQQEEQALPWSKAKEHINRLYPPASYKLEDSPDFKHIAEYINEDEKAASFRRSGGFLPQEVKDQLKQQLEQDEPALPGMVPAPMPDCKAPVHMMSARYFLGALRAEYLNGYEGSVSDYFERGAVSEDDQKVLATYQDTVRTAENKEARIEEIATEWGLHSTGQGNIFVEDDMNVESHPGDADHLGDQ